MKTLLRIKTQGIVALLFLASGLVEAQQQQPRPSPLPQPLRGGGFGGGETAPAPSLSQFDLNFPGGTVTELIEAINAAGAPINVIIPTDARSTQIPALNVKRVTVQSLLPALGQASTKYLRSANSNGGLPPVGRMGGPQILTSSYQFVQVSGVGDSAVWSFVVTAPPGTAEDLSEPERICRFYNLSRYLTTYSVEDITTAIVTGYKMLGSSVRPPALKFHGETSLLIAVGSADQMRLIESALEQLTPVNPETPAQPKKPELKAASKSPGN